MASSGASPPRTADQRSPQRHLLGVQRLEGRLQLGPLRGPARVLVGRRRCQLVGQASALGLERRDDVHVGGGVQGSDDAAGPLPQHGRGAAGPLHQALDPAEGVGQVLLPA